MKNLFLTIFSSFIFAFNLFGQTYLDVSYGKTPERDLKLDLYMPEDIKNPLMVVWVHGGAWREGSKEDPPKDLLKRGYALASIDYRLSIEAPFPAMMHDIKAAIRFLRGNAQKYGFQKDKIIIWGSSAGGNLVVLAGLTNDNEALEGTIGDYTDESSDVNMVLDFYGPTNFKTILAQSTTHGVNVRKPALELLYGKSLEVVDKETVELASPIFHVNSDSPPTFIAHGNQDNQVPINQSIELWLKLKQAGVKTEFEILENMGHGGRDFSEKVFIDKVESFITENL